LAATPRGNSVWSGGAVGPEGSLLVLGILLVLLATLCILHGRRRPFAALRAESAMNE
jgi:hypothetical protein